MLTALGQRSNAHSSRSGFSIPRNSCHRLSSGVALATALKTATNRHQVYSAHCGVAGACRIGLGGGEANGSKEGGDGKVYEKSLGMRQLRFLAYREDPELASC